MECKGTVTEVAPYYGFFQVDNKFTVYLGNNTLNLPTPQSQIKATNLHKFETTYVACRKSVLNGDFRVKYQSNLLRHLIKTHGLGVSDLLVVHKILKLLETFFSKENYELQDLVTRLLESLIKMQEKVPAVKESCLNKLISHVDLITISSCRYVEIQSGKYCDFPTWSFGVHYKPKKNSLLFGFMFLHQSYGFFMLKDKLHQMICIVINKESNIENLDNSFVLIKDYNIITEVFKDSKVPNLEYLIVNSTDIVIVHSLEKNILLGKNPPVKGFKYKKEMILYRKSTVCLGTCSQTETYLEVLFNNFDINGTKRFFLTLPFHYTSINSLLREGYKYNLHHNSNLVEFNNPLLTSIEKLKNLILKEQQAYFEELGYAGNSKIYKIIPAAQFKKYVSKNAGLLSFEAVVTSRGFVDNLYVDSFRKTKEYGFTTPGTDVHTVAFSNDTNDGLIVYLSNWMNRLMPLGLIPEMRVRVKNVLAQSKYIKCTVFTSFEIVAYEPKVPFRTANLYGSSLYGWGPSYYLSHGNDIPQDVMVWSQIQNIFIVEVKMSCRCNLCETLIGAAGPCLRCNSWRRDMQFSLAMYASDEFGRSRVIVENVNFLRLILNVPERRFSEWLKNFKYIGNYDYNEYVPESRIPKPPDTPGNLFQNKLTELVEKFNQTYSNRFEILCRKKSESQKNLWIYVDGRKDSF